MHKLSLNRIQQLPKTISKEERLRVQQDPEIDEAGLGNSWMKSELCESYGLTSAAIHVCDPLIENLVAQTDF